MMMVRGPNSDAAGHRYSAASASPAESDATDAMRASQVIQPTSKPMKEPNASRVYR